MCAPYLKKKKQCFLYANRINQADRTVIVQARVCIECRRYIHTWDVCVWRIDFF